jgi:hypothetical protein
MGTSGSRPIIKDLSAGAGNDLSVNNAWQRASLADGGQPAAYSDPGRWEAQGLLSPAVVVTLLAFAALGGVVGWRRGTRFVYRRSLSEPNLPSGVTRRDFDRRLRRRRKVQRFVTTALYALLGLALGAVVVGFMAR